MGDSLQLASADSVRILLFELEKPRSIVIQAKDGNLKIKVGNRRPVTIGEDEKFTIDIAAGKLRFRYGRFTYSALRIRVMNEEISLIRTNTTKNGIRYYRGWMDFSYAGNHIKTVNTVGLEDYVSSVVGGEMNFTEPEALKVQAVISRTYALWNYTKFSNDEFDLTDHTLSQVYKGELIEKPHFRDAAMATAGEIATWSGRLILAVYSSTCGGRTANNEEVWSGEPVPYLRSVEDGMMCSASPHYHWNIEVNKNDVHRLLQQTSKYQPAGFSLERYSETSRVKNLRIHPTSTRQDTAAITANAFRLSFMKKFGATSLKSTFFDFANHTNTPGTVGFVGRGLGHGIGVCQWGARGFAQAGWNYKNILKFYYKGVEIIDYHDQEATYLQLANF